MKLDPRYQKRPSDNVDPERYQIPDGGGQIPSLYDMNNEEAQDLDQRNPQPFFTTILDLSAARDIRSNPYIVEKLGRGFVIFGISGSVSTANLSNIEAVDTTVCVFARVGKNGPEAMQFSEREWAGKNGRPYRGDFKKLFLGWPAQNGKSARLYIFHYNATPAASDGSAT